MLLTQMWNGLPVALAAPPQKKSLRETPATGATETVGGRQANRLPWQVDQHPPSDLIEGISFDFTTRRIEGLGSDLWPITWAADGELYTTYGDGAGFNVLNVGESNGKDRVSVGVSRITGGPDDYRAVNVWGGKQAEHPATFKGKGTGILSVDGVLFMFIGGPDSLCIYETGPAVSYDQGKSWTKADWHWTDKDGIFAGNFCNFGRDYASARDHYVYVYFTRIQSPPESRRSWIHETPGMVDLARVPKDKILEQNAYEWFAGITEDHQPRWTSRITERQPAFEDPNGIKIVSVSCNLPLKRYLLVYNPYNNAGNFGCFEATEPWGPWKRVAYLQGEPEFHPPNSNWRVSLFHFVPKWWSADGREFTLIYNVGDDQWNTVRGKLQLK
ncbi:DUF4185 domain-containing protein [Planctomicrobium sp. SH664]|uniref:DUF4185 domain-containing protein n=1 Tax=Planctomicrobium sp. SH664 TaxID=3448125 RepID=UPI003F5B6E45